MRHASRSYEALVRDRLKFRVGQVVCAAFSQGRDDHGLRLPERRARRTRRIRARQIPRAQPLRHAYRWVQARLDAIDVDELRELLVDAWRMCSPNLVRDAYDQLHGAGPVAP
jgi:hypothetical protein